MFLPLGYTVVTETRSMPIATGETRQITKWFTDGWFNCPWCRAANPPDAQHCDNPACWASTYATAENVRADQDRRARAAAEREQREQAAAAQAAAQAKYQEQRAELWQRCAATATERGACLTCLRASRWETEPLYRRPDFHAASA